jgi:hypothetical protein
MLNRRPRESISLLALGAGERVLLAFLPIALIWVAVAWALY